MFPRLSAILLFIFITISNLAVSQIQGLELLGGVDLNNFWEHGKDNHIDSDYEIRTGYYIGIGAEKVRIDWLTLRIQLGFNQYSGIVNETYIGLASTSWSHIQFEKSVISLSIFPLNTSLIKNLDLNAGFDVSRLLNEKFQGTINSNHLSDSGYINTSISINDNTDEYSSKWNFGMKARIAYHINITDSWSITPQYCFFLGLTDEFSERTHNTKLLGHCIYIGLKKQLNK